MASIERIHFCNFLRNKIIRRLRWNRCKSSDDKICFENLSSSQYQQSTPKTISDALEDEFLDFERFCVDFILLTMSKRFEFVSSQLAQAQKETASHIFCVKDDGTQASFFLSFYSILREAKVKSKDVL